MTSSEKNKGGLLALGVLRPVGVGMIVAAALVFGLISLGKLPVDLLPPINYPSITVRTAYPGAAPNDIEERVTDRLEDVLSTVGDLVNIHSSSRAEVSEIYMEFGWDSELPLVVQDVRERLDRVFLPTNVEKPLILRYDPSLDPVIRLSLSGGNDLVRLRDIAESEIERQLEGISGVAAVRVKGGLEDEVQVFVDPHNLANYKLTAETIQSRLQQENLNVPGGKLEEGSIEYVVRTLNQFQSLADIENLPIVTRGSTVIKLGDIARVVRGSKDRDMILRSGGEEAVEIAIYREAGSNISEVANTVRNKLFGTTSFDNKFIPGISADLSSDLSLNVLSDQSVFIESAISEVKSAAAFGGMFAVLVCYIFLRRFATTFVIGIAVPISIIATFGAMYSSGVSLNIMSLGGLALGIGMLVDNAIVVLESITRCREEGDSPQQAAIRGVREVGSAVVASTLTTIAVFAPIIFVEGIAGQTFGDQALTVVASLLISLAIALFFIPGLAARVNITPQDTSSVNDRFRNMLGALLPFIRQRRLFKDLGFPSSKMFILFAMICGAAASYLLGDYVPGLDDSFQPEDGSGMGKWEGNSIPTNVQKQIALFRFAGLVLFMPFAWLAVLPLTTLVARLGFDLFGLVVFVIKTIMGAFFETIRVALFIPTAGFNIAFSATEKVYLRLLKGAIRRPTLVLLFALFVSIYSFSITRSMGRELLPEVLQGEIHAQLYYPAGNTLKDTDRISTNLERQIANLNGVLETSMTAGTDRETVANDESGPHTSQISVRINTEVPDAHAQEMLITDQLREIFDGEPALARYNLRRPTVLALNAPLEIEIIGQNIIDVKKASEQLFVLLQDVPGLNDLRSSLRRGNPELRVSLDRDKLARYNLTAAQVSKSLRIAVEGETASTFPGHDERIDIRVRAEQLSLSRVEQLKNIPINPEADRPLPLSAVASFTIADGPSDIRHIRSKRAAVLSASTDGSSLGDIRDEVQSRISQLSLPPGIRINIAGQTNEMEEALASLSFALALAIFLVYAVMAAQFESLLQPLLILCTVPMAGAGAIWVMAATNTPISVIALLGAVILAGIVVNNAIVLVDRINQNIARGVELVAAIVEAGSARLRPILMTTFTTVLGMLPMTGWIPALGGADGAELRTPMALVVMSGLICATILTLVVVPCGYSLMARLNLRNVN
ncbi:MAG: efflux RND transporter permease subunit [Planctomycetota bacterium]|nr:efflux RND transporter permease subunit [Planctomycetota bacterium]